MVVYRLVEYYGGFGTEPKEVRRGLISLKRARHQEKLTSCPRLGLQPDLEQRGMAPGCGGASTGVYPRLRLCADPATPRPGYSPLFYDLQIPSTSLPRSYHYLSK